MEPAAFIQQSLNRIWNEKMVGSVYETFTRTVRVHRSCREGLYGQEAVMADVIERLAAFPDLHLTIEDIVWMGNEEQGYRVSIRMSFAGHNLGVSRYGAATQQEVEQAVLMNARVIDGRFFEVWIAEDERSLVEQLGYDLQDAMHTLEQMEQFIGQPISEDLPPSIGEIPHYEKVKIPTEQLAQIQLHDESDVREVLAALWNGRQIGLCERFYAEDFTCHWASNQHLEGPAEYQAVVLAQCATFPNLHFHIDDVIGQRREDGWHVAVSWTMLGTHAGPSLYGRPSGRRVHISGISQYVIRNGQFVSERTEYNEFRLMQQIIERRPATNESEPAESPEDTIENEE